MSCGGSMPGLTRWRCRGAELWAGVTVLAGGFGVACAGERARDAQDATSRSAPGVWEYRVHAAPGARELAIEAELPLGVPAELGVDVFADPYLSELEVATDSGWQPLARQGRRWIAPLCRTRGCRLRYHYHLGEAAEQIDRFAYAGFRGGVLMAPPSTFLLAPQDYTGGDTYRFRVEAAPGEEFVTGVWREAKTGFHAAPARVLFQAPYSAFGRFERERLVVGEGAIDLAIAPGEVALGVSRAALRGAIEHAASAVVGYYGRFPVPEVTLIVLPSPGSTTAGMQLGNGGASIVFFVGDGVGDGDLAHDWVLTHELLHLGFPTLPRRQLWLAEGLATYQEALARARAGLIDEQELWRAFLEGMPKGLPNDTDGGLDGSTRWGRTYWGGALFCLLLDVQIRTRTRNELSLDSAARAILQAGGDTSVRWSIGQTLAAGDAALDLPSLSRLYAEHATAAVRVDLPALFRRLGVRREGEGVTFDEQAELAHVRRAIRGDDRARVHDVQSGLAAPGVPKSPL